MQGTTNTKKNCEKGNEIVFILFFISWSEIKTASAIIMARKRKLLRDKLKIPFLNFSCHKTDFVSIMIHICATLTK